MASIMKRGDSYSVRYKYKDHSGKPCEGWESFKTKKEAQERKITVEKELLDGTFLVPDTMTVEEMLYKWIPIQSTKHKWSPKTYTQSVAMVQNLIVPYIGNRKVQELRTYDIEKFYATLAKTPCGQYVKGIKQKLSEKQKKRLLSSTSIHEVHTLLKTAFSYAVEWDLIHKIPLPRDAPKVNIEERTIWDEKTEAGSYIEIFFPKHHVRYIAITDGVDSLTRQEMDITPFKNILNDMYSRDISKKVLAGVMTRSRQGKFCGGTPPYGLMRDPKDNGHLIIDPDAAPVIRKIYDYALDGMGNMRIAKKLLEEKIPITRVKANTALDANYYTWGTARIGHILRNPFYKGAHLVCRTHQTGIRSGSFKFIPREEWEIIENCHEAIVTPEEWAKVQELIDRRPTIMTGNDCPYYNIFHGIIYCATCGKSMQARYEKVGRKDVNRTTKKKREPIDKAFFTCQTYNRIGCKVCSSHKIEARRLELAEKIDELLQPRPDSSSTSARQNEKRGNKISGKRCMKHPADGCERT